MFQREEILAHKAILPAKSFVPTISDRLLSFLFFHCHFSLFPADISTKVIMTLVNLSLLAFLFVYSASCATEVREHYLTYGPIPVGDSNILPAVRINNESPLIMTPIENRYYTSHEIDNKKVTKAEIIQGPRNYGCYIASEVKPYRSDFFTADKPLTTKFTNKYGKDLRCYALLRPESDVAVGIVLPTGQTGMIVLDGNKGFSSRKASEAMQSLLHISIIEEPKRGLQCRIDLEDGNSVILDAQKRSQKRISGISRIGCAYFPPQGRFILDLP